MSLFRLCLYILMLKSQYLDVPVICSTSLFCRNAWIHLIVMFHGYFDNYRDYTTFGIATLWNRRSAFWSILNFISWILFTTICAFHKGLRRYIYLYGFWNTHVGLKPNFKHDRPNAWYFLEVRIFIVAVPFQPVIGHSHILCIIQLPV